VLRVIREILFFQPRRRGTDLPLALRTVNHLLKRKAVCFVLSDFLTEETQAWLRPPVGARAGDLQRIIALTGRRHDLICVELHDPREAELPNVGILTLEDSETGELLEVDTAESRFRALFAAQNQRRRDELKLMCGRAGVDWLPLSTAESWLQPLRKFLAARGGRR
jgi:uncharacterized protein (DUF58 family)